MRHWNVSSAAGVKSSVAASWKVIGELASLGMTAPAAGPPTIVVSGGLLGPQFVGGPQAPVVGLQTLAPVHHGGVGQDVAVPAAQAPATQWSPLVQRLPSSHVVPSG
jgi:hypothetical protein